MPGILDATTIDLDDTATHTDREACWVPTCPGCGLLVIRQRVKRKTMLKPLERDLYQVEEEQAPPGVMGRAFLILNVSDPGQRDVYHTRVGPAHACTCDAGRCKVPETGATDGCKHRDALRDLIEEGVID